MCTVLNVDCTHSFYRLRWPSLPVKLQPTKPALVEVPVIYTAPPCASRKIESFDIVLVVALFPVIATFSTYDCTSIVSSFERPYCRKVAAYKARLWRFPLYTLHHRAQVVSISFDIVLVEVALFPSHMCTVRVDCTSIVLSFGRPCCP